MSGTAVRRIVISAPAKLNLGLEVVARRDDGFHELATIFVALDLADRLILHEDDALSLTCDDPALDGQQNLALRALHALRDVIGYTGGARLELRKSIPLAAGLGGASSDAAAALLAARQLWRLDISDDELAAIGARLGSDVPFFLDRQTGCALGRGRGDLIEPLPLPDRIWFVVVAPAVTIPRKTASLYARLRPTDFSDGRRVQAQADRLRSGQPLDPELLGNTFSRPLHTLSPQLETLPELMRHAGAPLVALTGAGPAHYTVLADAQEATRIAETLRSQLPTADRVIVANPHLPH